MEPVEMEAATGPEVYREHVKHPLNNTNNDRLSLENSLSRLGLSAILQKLDNSLEDVRRLKKSIDEHDQYLKHVDETILKLSPHLDEVLSKGGSDLEMRTKLLSDLHGTRRALQVLTDELLKNIEIGYKYGYFAQLDVRSLVNQNETEHLIKGVFDRVYKLSGVKRRIIGEIRNFLVESRQCVQSYPSNTCNFMKHRSSAMHHLQKCIDGYNQLVTECDALERECKLESEENVRRVIKKIKERGFKQSEVLTALENVARSSLEGGFQIFIIQEGMDEYFVLPIVYYVNVLLMCSAAVEEDSNLPSRNLDPFANPYFEKAPNLFAKAYYLASYLYGNRQYIRTVEAITRKKKSASTGGKNGHDSTVMECEVREKFMETLSAVAVFLETEFEIDAYDGEKRDREKPSERFERLKETMANSEENMHTCSEENQEILRECQEVEMKNEEGGNEMLESLEQNRKAIESFILSWEESTAENGGVSQNCNQEGRRKKPATDVESQKEFNQKLGDLLSDIKQNMSKNKSRILDLKCPREDVTVCEKDNQGIWRECHQDMKNGEEKKSPESFGQNRSAIEELSLNCEGSTSVKKRVQGTESEKKQVVEEKFQKPIGQKLMDLMSDLKQNIPENKDRFLDKKQENSEKNDQAVEEDIDTERVKEMKNTVPETKSMSEKLSELLVTCVQNVAEQGGSSPNETQENLNQLRQILKDGEKNKRKILRKHRPG